MFKCNLCNRSQKGSINRIVTEIREVTYNRFIPRFNPIKRVFTSVVNGSYNGHEIVKEINVCNDCEEYGRTSTQRSRGSKNVNFFFENDSRLTKKAITDAKEYFNESICKKS